MIPEIGYPGTLFHVHVYHKSGPLIVRIFVFNLSAQQKYYLWKLIPSFGLVFAVVRFDMTPHCLVSTACHQPTTSPSLTLSCSLFLLQHLPLHHDRMGTNTHKQISSILVYAEHWLGCLGCSSSLLYTAILIPGDVLFAVLCSCRLGGSPKQSIIVPYHYLYNFFYKYALKSSYLRNTIII